MRLLLKRKTSRLLIATLMTLGVDAAAAQTVTDGDTLRMDGKTYRLWGIDAPESRQVCPDGWPAGRMATTRLQELVTGKYVVCERTGSDQYGRTIAICTVRGEDLGATLVREGMAWAFRRYSDDYVQDEARAKSAGLGVHAHGCIPAWEWRLGQRR